MLSPIFEERYASMDNLTMKRTISDLRRRADEIKLELIHHPPFGNASIQERRDRVALERDYANVCLQKEQLKIYMKSLRGTLFAKKRSARQMHTLKKMSRSNKLPKLKHTEEKILQKKPLHCPHLLCYLPDLVYLMIVRNLKNRRDVRSFYMSLDPDERGSIEFEFCKHLQKCCWSETQQLDDSFSMICDSYCGNPTLCVRCYLNSKVRCIGCKQLVEDSGENEFTITKCDNFIDTNRTKRCKDMQKCTCGFKYHVSEEEKVRRLIDLRCMCFLDEDEQILGCIMCTVECDQCANIGCNKDHHFRVFNKLSFKNKEQWPTCDDCNHKHCCAVLSKHEFEWDYCVCPKFEEF